RRSEGKASLAGDLLETGERRARDDAHVNGDLRVVEIHGPTRALAHVRPQLGVELDRAQREALVASTRADSKAAWRGTILTKEALVEPSLERIDGRFDARRGNEPRRSEHFPQPAHAAIELGVGSDLDDDAAVLPLGAKAFEAAKRPSDAPLELLLEARAIPLLQDDLVVVDEDMRGLRQGPSRARLGWKLFLGHRHRLYLL